jgi:hypothetical protein
LDWRTLQTKEYHVFSESDKDPLFDEKGEPAMADEEVRYLPLQLNVYKLILSRSLAQTG